MIGALKSNFQVWMNNLAPPPAGLVDQVHHAGHSLPVYRRGSVPGYRPYVRAEVILARTVGGGT